MTRISLRKGLHLAWQGREYVIEQCLTTGEVQLLDVLTNHLSTLKATALTQLLVQGELEFIEVEAKRGNQSHSQKGYISADFPQLPSELREESKRRYRYIERVLSTNILKRTESNLKPIINQVSTEIEDSQPPSWLTLWRWLKDYEASGRDIRSLVPKYVDKGNRQPRLNPEVRKIISKAIEQVYLKPEQASGTDVYERVVIEINHSNCLREAIGQDSLEIPNIAAIYRAIRQLDPYAKAVGRYGKRIASQMYDQVQKSPHPLRPLERVEIDHTKLPLFVVDTQTRMPIGTPWLTSAVDKYSGVILGYYASFEPPSYLSVMQCLLHAISPKNYLHSQFKSVENTWDTYGLPEVIVVDNGKEFYSTHFEDACLQLGIVIQYSPPKMPWYKSAIERYFGALNSQLLSDTPGKTFSNFLQISDYDPKNNAVISFEALLEILHIFMVDIHNQSSHPELKSPRWKVWELAITEFPPALPPSNQELKVLVSSITTRKVTRRGVEFEGLLYNSSELARLRSNHQSTEKATIKYDPTDLSRLYVLDPTTHQFLEVPALSTEYTKGLTLWQHQIVKQLARQEAETVDIVALSLAKEKIQLIVEREWNSSKKGRTRTAMARWLGIGRSGSGECSQSQESNDNSSQLHSISGLSDLGSTHNSNPPQESLPSPEVPQTSQPKSRRRSSTLAGEQKVNSPAQPVNLLVSLLTFCRLPGIRQQVFPPKETSLGLDLDSVSEFERVFALFKNWPDDFCQLMDRYEVYLGYGSANRYVSGWLFRDVRVFFASVFIWFSQEHWGFLQEVFADYFERFLRKVSIKNVQISFYKNFRYDSVCISLTRTTPLTEKLASITELGGLTLAKLFATSRIDMYNETVFFRINFFPS